MANSKLYYYPSPVGGFGGAPTREEIDFGETISDLQITPYRVVNDAVSIGGMMSRTARRVGMAVRIVHERFTDDALAEKLYSLQSHLERGGAFSFAVDSSNVFCAFGEDALPAFRGQTSMLLTPNLFGVYSATTLASGDVLHVESPSPRANREEARVDSYVSATNVLTFDGSLNYDHDGPVMVRHRDFFPALFWPESQTGGTALSHDHRISWTWDISCEFYPSHVFEMWAGKGEEVGANTEDQVGYGGMSLDESIGAASVGGTSSGGGGGWGYGPAPGFSETGGTPSGESPGGTSGGTGHGEKLWG